MGANIKGMVDKQHPNRAGTSGMVIVQTPIELLPEEYISWEFNGLSNTGISMDAALLGTALNILGTGKNGAIALSINATKAGEYEIGSNAEEGKSSIMVSQSNQSQVIFQSFYSICNQPGVQYGKGKVIIETFGPIGGFIKGNFSAQVYAPSGCSPSGKLVTGNFKLRRKA
ncbi:DUF6252 family protein [Sphingobacterium sp. 18053]|uniref:DUF6252 family protein n=1 Tax=Sphingobacterium sp. 18053 TaxID=2681401 RepID=UPI00135871AB|nr:DUF6252 family protein [Sphingobacterium sp. 18053]